MIVRVSARGQANGSADGYLCAREQLGQAEGPCAPATTCGLPGLRITKCYQVLYQNAGQT